MSDSFMNKEQSNFNNQGESEMTIKKDKSWSFKEFVIFILITLAIVVPVRTYIAQPFIISGDSMDPTFADGQYLIVDQLSYRLNDPQRGDVVIFRLPLEQSRFLIKRLIALPEESVKIEGQNIYIKKVNEDDFTKLDEEYITYPNPDGTILQETLGENQFFLLGDNRPNSLDSRFFGTIDRKFIVGRALTRLFPFNKIDWMPGKHEF